ncbi:hypothetical protein B0H13DRAFT_2319885 [Mycena leptocephala]|nr:hypothetical protein B0H13DRAFT_2319885 [Mycena leptocephala]
MTRKLGKQHPRCPDTSNTCFGTYGEAFAELTTHLEPYLEMMDIIQWSEHNPSLTNIDKNLANALQVRGPGTENTNLLDLGPLQATLCEHIQPKFNPQFMFK